VVLESIDVPVVDGAPQFNAQHAVEFDFHGYRMQFPSQHILLSVADGKSEHHQPYREAGFAQICRVLGGSSKSGTVIDVGANVGDSCAIVHKNSAFGILCLEPSEFFFPYLQRNIADHFSDRAIARQTFVVASEDDLPKKLWHWAGTAKPTEVADENSAASVSMARLIQSTPDTVLLKIDTDGLDLDLAIAALRTGGKFPIYFEFEFQMATRRLFLEHLEKIGALLNKAKAAGYRSAYLWDDPGRFFGKITLDHSREFINALNYMGHLSHRPFWGFDICLVHTDHLEFMGGLDAALSSDLLLGLPEG
jgi:FkbM family methyltransferase